MASTPLIPAKDYGSIPDEENAYGLRKRLPKSNRPGASSSSAGAIRSTAGIKLPPRQLNQGRNGRGKAVLTSLWALQSLREQTQAGHPRGDGDGDGDHAGANPQQQRRKQHKHSWAYDMLNPRSHQLHARIFKNFMASVILTDLSLYVLSTDPKFKREDQRHEFFASTEAITSSIFLVEYVLRLLTCVESRRFQKYGPIVGRLRYVVTIPALIDAAATFPFFLELLLDVDLPTLTFLRAFRLLRIMKTNAFSKALTAVYRVIYYNREILWVAFILCIFLVLVTAFLMYYLRPREPTEDAADFSSIGATMYLSTLMLTGQGGPEGDLPWYTKSVVLLTGVFSIGMFAIPASMLTWGFEAEAERLAARAIQKARVRRKKAGDEGEYYSSTTSSSSSAYSGGWHHYSSSLDTSDEEYQRVIAGDDEEQDRLSALFEDADADHSGSLGKSEFFRIMGEVIHKQSSDIGSGGGREVNEEMVERVQELEKKVEMVNRKLDEVLEILTTYR
jgi:hypothetical protein